MGITIICDPIAISNHGKSQEHNTTASQTKKPIHCLTKTSEKKMERMFIDQLWHSIKLINKNDDDSDRTTNLYSPWSGISDEYHQLNYSFFSKMDETEILSTLEKLLHVTRTHPSLDWLSCNKVKIRFQWMQGMDIVKFRWIVI